jgi:hypothetical protein
MRYYTILGYLFFLIKQVSLASWPRSPLSGTIIVEEIIQVGRNLIVEQTKLYFVLYFSPIWLNCTILRHFDSFCEKDCFAKHKISQK